ncbi:MAG: IclR family transcriptional regulator [Rhizobiaceae bacterium]|nr:IclR family transcriptional regulator [Rhizobiaceae bacterium]MCO5071626.1 IclR family transcriptional regulator [Rhizobiaceae bacterium]
MDKTLLKGLSLLETLSRSPTARGVSELAEEVGLTRSNTHRTLQTLVAAGYVHQNEASNYGCTLKLFELANAVLARVDVVEIAQPAIQALAAKTLETVHLSVLDGVEVIYLQKIDSPQPVRAYTSVGGRSPAYCVATGKALLAHMGRHYLDQLEGQMRAYTPRTITNVATLAEELRQVRKQHYAINRGEWRASVCGLASAIFDASGRPVAGIGISGPTERLKVTRLREFSEDVVMAARQISKALGYSPHFGPDDEL